MLDLIYLASPYSHMEPLVVKSRFRVTEFVTYHFMKQRQAVWSPIVHCHELAANYRLPTDANYWMEYNFAFIARCQRVRVLKLPDWEKSIGVQEEIKFAEKKHKDLEFIDWPDIVLAIQQRLGEGDLYLRAMYLEHHAPKM